MISSGKRRFVIVSLVTFNEKRSSFFRGIQAFEKPPVLPGPDLDYKTLSFSDDPRMYVCEHRDGSRLLGTIARS